MRRTPTEYTGSLVIAVIFLRLLERERGRTTGGCFQSNWFCRLASFFPLLPPIFHFGIGPFGMELSNIFLDSDVIIFQCHLTTILIMIDTLFAVTRNDILTQQFDCFVRYLSFSGSLFHVVQIRDRIFGPTALQLNTKQNTKKTYKTGIELKYKRGDKQNGGNVKCEPSKKTGQNIFDLAWKPFVALGGWVQACDSATRPAREHWTILVLPTPQRTTRPGWCPTR